MQSYQQNLVNTIAAEFAKYSLLASRMRPAKAKRLDRLVKNLETATPLDNAAIYVDDGVVDENPHTNVVDDGESQYTKYTLLSIDALRDECGGWDWNDVSKIEEGIMIADDSDVLKSSRNLLAWMRKSGWLNDASKGKVKVDFGSDIYVIEIQNKNTGEPLLALSSVH